MKEENFRYTIEDNPNIDVGYLSKPTTTISSPDIDFKYVPIINEQGDTQRMLAGDLGKNSANSKLTSVAGAGLELGAVWGIKTKGFPFRIEDLPDETGSPIPAGKLMVREDGTVVVNKEPDVALNLPDRVGFTAPPTTLNVTITNVAPPTITVAGNPNFAEEIQELMSSLIKIDWTDFTADDYGSPILEDGTPRFKLDSSGFITPTTELRSKLTFPFEKDWILKIKIHNKVVNPWDGAPISAGLYRTETLVREYYPSVNGFHILIFVKKGNVIYRCIYTPNGNWQQAVFPLQENLGAIGIYTVPFRQRVSYKILN